MKNPFLWGIAAFALAIILAAIALRQFGEPTPIIAGGWLEISEELQPNARDIRTVYITIFDQNSPMPMPYGAMKDRIAADAQGRFHRFSITNERLQVMNPGRPLPENMRIKARLDLDGLAGMDQPGDITGELTGVRAGQNDLVVTLDQKIEAAVRSPAKPDRGHP